MRKTPLIVFSLLCWCFVSGQDPFSGVSGLFTADGSPPDVTVGSPNGGETFNYLSPFTVNWTATDNSFGTAPISIGISTEQGGAYTIVASNLPNTGSATVTPPGVVTDYAKVWVIAADTFGIEANDGSDGYFTFDESFNGVSALFIADSKPPDAVVVSPNGGESYPYIGPMTVNWTASDDSFGNGAISIGLSLDPGGSYSIVASGLPNTGQAVIDAPGFATQTAKVWVIAADTFGLQTTDGSDDFFAFNESFAGVSGLFIADSKPPVVSVISPNGGEAYYYAEPLLVKWSATDDSFGATPVAIEVSTDGGATFEPVASGLPNADSAFVTAPEMITNQALVKVFVQDEFGLTAFDNSDGVFSLDGFYLDLKAFLEGPFSGTGMLSYLNFFGYLPLTHPYDAAPWNYSGDESVAAIPNNDVVDWVLIEIRDAVDAASATGGTVVHRQAGFIMEDGSITTLDGSNDLQIGFQANDNLFAVVWHRNHLGVMSANPLSLASGVYSYDFTAGANQVFGGGNGHNELVSGVWGMISADGNADGQINNADKNDVWAAQAGNSGYLPGDFSMDGQVNTPDKNDLWYYNSGSGGQVPEGVKKCYVPK